MGGGSSIVQNKEQFRPSVRQRMRDMDSGRISTRSGNVSVRAMALMNHSRQENSYISQDALSAHFIKHSKRIPTKDPGSIHFPFHPPIRELERSTSDAGPSGSDGPSPVAIGPSLVNKAHAGGLSLLPGGLGLKINIQDDADWIQVSDDEPDQEADVFDMALIEVPSQADSDKVTPKGIILHDKSTNKFTQKGTIFVDGIKIGIGIHGIVKQSEAEGPKVLNKLTMRERLIVLCKLGAGASSVVYKALDLQEMRLVALKMIHVNDREKRIQMIRELCGLYQLLRENSRRESSHMPKHFRRPEKYIVDFYDAFSNIEDGMVSLMIEYMDGGSLQDIVDEGGCDDEPTLANIAVQGLKGLSFLHSCNQIHRDLKPGNFLISHRGEVKVADLGIMKQLTLPTGKLNGGSQILPKTATFVGTATYMSPERIDGKEYSFSADVWAFGLSLATIATGNLPIDTQGGYWSILHSIRDAPPPTVPKDKFSPEFVDFVGQCLKRNPDERMSCKQLLKHPFLNKVQAEDLTYDQSYDRGRNELHSIINALLMHIKQLKSTILQTVSTKSSEENEAWKSHRLFGNLMDSEPIDIAYRVILGENFRRINAGSGNNSNSNSNRVPGNTSNTDEVPPMRNTTRLKRPRLMNLAKQLHLPVEKVSFECRAYLEVLAKQEDANNHSR